MKSPNQPHSLQLAIDLLLDLGEMCSIDVRRDIKTIISRYEHEGLSFLTLTLPKFCDDFFSYTEFSNDSTLFAGWRKRGCLPAFLQGFTSQCSRTSPNGGIYYEAIRQIGFFFKKPKTKCSVRLEKKAIDNFVHTDTTLSSVGELDPSTVLTGRIIISSIFNVKIEVDDLIFHHGPGAVFEKSVNGNKKYFLKNILIPKRYKNTPFDFEHYYHSEEECNIDQVDPCYGENEECPVRIVMVPKTQSSPRVIAVEPTFNQFIQQGLKDYMVQKIESKELTRNIVNFTSQQINRDLALSNSIDRTLATIDLKDASDRVKNTHVISLFSANRDLNELLQLTRSTHALLPNGNLLELNKFASMGSAVCFPVEALVFFILVASFRLQKASLPPTYRNIYNVTRDVRVYGDDILAPASEIDELTRFLHERGVIVSQKKSFFKSFFRESCGCDAYGGRVITPTYLRQFPYVNSIRKAPEIVSLVSTGNQLLKKGFLRSFNNLKDNVEKITGPLPNLGETSPGLGWHRPVNTSDFKNKIYRYNRRLQRLEVKTFIPTVQKYRDRINGSPALLKFFLLSGIPERDDLSISVRRGSLTLKRRWTTLY